MTSSELYEALRDFDAETNAYSAQRGVDRIELAQAYHAAKEAEEKPKPEDHRRESNED